MSTPVIAGLDGLFWQGAPERWMLAEDGAFEMRSGPKTDMFVSPDGSAETLNAPRLCCDVGGDWMLHARITPFFGATFDAGALLVWSAEREWGKLCFEHSPQGQPMVVSVVTRERSDDCNSTIVDGYSVYLRIARMGAACAFHASTDGVTWNLVRHFTIAMQERVTIGLVAQSPLGEGCDVTFRNITLRRERLSDIRNGA